MFYFSDVGKSVANEGSIEEGDFPFNFGIFSGVDISLAVFCLVNIVYLLFRLTALYRLVVEFLCDLNADWKVVGASDTIHKLSDILVAEGVVGVH